MKKVSFLATFMISNYIAYLSTYTSFLPGGYFKTYFMPAMPTENPEDFIEISIISFNEYAQIVAWFHLNSCRVRFWMNY